MSPLSWLKLEILSLFQDYLIFKPNHGSVKAQENPRGYGLLGVVSYNLKTADNVYLKIWYKKASTSYNPTFILFHGNTGNWGDVGRPEEGENHDPEYRINLLREIGRAGAGFLAVSLRGYGKSKGRSGEKGFIKDVHSIINYSFNTLEIPPEKIIIFGESLGASVAMIAAEEMTLRQKPPAVVALVSAFSSMSEKVKELYPNLSVKSIEKRLRHKFNSEDRMKNLSKVTAVYIAYPKDDLVTSPKHSQRLAVIAEATGLETRLQEVSGGHITWNPSQIVQEVLNFYRKCVEKG